MDFKELEDKLVQNAERYSKKHNIPIDEDYAVHKLYEEVGEFAQAYLIHHRKCREEKYRTQAESKAMLAKELADIVGVSVVIAGIMGIDLEQAMNDKWISKLKK